MKKKLKVFLLLILVVLAFWGVGTFRQGNSPIDKRQAERDQLSQLKEKVFKTYQPSPEIEAIAEKLSFTKKGLTIFYISKPKLLETKAFIQAAPQNLELKSTLGFYSNQEIVIHHIQNPELTGIVEVTAAHEALHAYWERLSTREQARISQLLEADYQKVKTEKSEKLMADYEKIEPGQRANELHSILGTEYSHLSPELEKHYSLYFKNREKIVSMAASYQAKFDELSQIAEQLSAEISSLKAEIDQEVPQYQADSATLNEEIAGFNAKADNYYYASEAAFEADRAVLEQKVSELTAREVIINEKITAYNAKIEAYNQNALRATELNKSIETRVEEPSLKNNPSNDAVHPKK